MFDVILKGGVVLDGTGMERVLADVGITRDEITAVGNLSGRRAERVIDARGKFILPGFVDIVNHADGYLTLFDRPSCDSLLRQGITTIVGGNCGTSLAPLGSTGASRVMRKWASLFGDDVTIAPSSLYEHFSGVQKWADVEGTNIDWLTMRDFLKRVDRLSLGLSFATYVGFGTLRRAVVGNEARPSSFEERSYMEEMLREALRDGAVGLSMGLSFAHEMGEERETLVRLAMIAAEEGNVLSVHLRDERDELQASVDEALDIARSSGASLVLSHMKAPGGSSPESYERVLERVTAAQQEGMEVNLTVYPYPMSYTVLHQYLPQWLYEGGWAAMLKRLRDDTQRDQAQRELAPQSDWYAGLIVARIPRSRSAIVGQTIQEIAADRGVDIPEAVLGVLEAGGGFVLCFDPSLSPEMVDATLTHPLSLVISEGASYAEEDVQRLGYLPHPRSFGAFPRFFADVVRERGLLSWEEGVQKCCSLPALKMGFRDRGFIAHGLRADLVVLDPEVLRDRATIHNPFLYPDGIDYVLVGGNIVVDALEKRSAGPVSTSAGMAIRQ